MEKKTIFQRVTEFFRRNSAFTNTPQSNPPLEPKIITSPEDLQQAFLDYQTAKLSYNLYTRGLYKDTDRLQAYADFRAMDNSPEISAALNIIRDECLTINEKGKIVEVYSNNKQVKVLLENFFHFVLNLDFNLRLWTRELIKYGDFFIYLHIEKNKGIVDFYVLPPDDVIREENYDNIPGSVRFKYIPGNSYYEEWQVAHFRLLDDSRRLPYGRSLLEPCRKLWKQLQLAEDALLVYRIARAPDRRVFYIEVGNMPPEEVGQYIREMQRKIKQAPLVNPNNHNVNYRYNVENILEDFWIPMRNGKSSKIETLSGASNLDSIQDVEYLQNKLFAALQVPRSYLNFDSNIGGSSLAQKDIRFARTIITIQQAIILELRRIANIHLFFNGLENEIDNFIITLNNPSPQLELMKIEIMKSRADLFESLVKGGDDYAPYSYSMAMQQVFGLSKKDIIQIAKQKKIEKRIISEINSGETEYKETGVFKDLDKIFKSNKPKSSSKEEDEKGHNTDFDSKYEKLKEEQNNNIITPEFEKILEQWLQYFPEDNMIQKIENSDEKHKILVETVEMLNNNLEQGLQTYAKTKNMIQRFKKRLNKTEQDEQRKTKKRK